MSTPELTLVVLEGGGSPLDLAATVGSFPGASGVSSARIIEEAGGQYFSRGGQGGSHWHDPTELISFCDTPFVTVATAGDLFEDGWYERQVLPLLEHPELVIAASVGVDDELHGTTFHLRPEGAAKEDVASTVDGRDFARRLLEHPERSSRFVGPITVRTNAAQSPVSPVSPIPQGVNLAVEWWTALLPALLRGPVLQENVPTGTSRRPTNPGERDLPSAWLRLRDRAQELGLLTEDSDRLLALVGFTRYVEQFLRREPLIDGTATARLVSRVVEEWKTLDANDSKLLGRHAPVGVESFSPGDPELRVARSIDARGGVFGYEDWLPVQQATLVSAGPRRRYVIAAPDYDESHGGVTALHRLCDRLNAIGHDAVIEPLGEAEGRVRPGWRTPLRRGRSIEEAVVVYPEIVTGNPLGARRIVRWLLNRPERFTGHPMAEGPDDLLISFDEQITPGMPILRLPLVDPTIFFPKDSPGTGDLLWIGKGVLPGSTSRANALLVTNTWPSTKVSLAEELRAADRLLTCDWLTSIVGESLLCGTPVVLIGEQEWSRNEVNLAPGMAWEDGDIDEARQNVSVNYTLYLEQLRHVDQEVAKFAGLVEQHFGRVVPW